MVLYNTLLEELKAVLLYGDDGIDIYGCEFLGCLQGKF